MFILQLLKMGTMKELLTSGLRIVKKHGILKEGQHRMTVTFTITGEDGKQAKDAWVQYKKAWYYLKPDGYMAEDYWTQYKGGWYYLKADGSMATGKTAVLHVFDSKGKCTK